MNTSAVAAALQIIIAALLAVALDWIPWLRTKWHPLESGQKKLYMSLILLVLLIGMALIECQFNNLCPVVWTDYILELVVVYLGGLAVNQSGHAISKPSEERVEGWLAIGD